MFKSKQSRAPAKTKRRLTQRSGLITIAALLLGSALLRVGDNAGQALALSGDQPTVPKQENEKAEERSKDISKEMDAMLKAFQIREARLKAQEDAIRDRMHALKIVDQQVAQKLEALEAAETALRETIALAETAAEGDLARLTKVYETMKPKQAAALFEEMTPEFAAGFLGRMRPDAAAAILAGLNPEAAHRFSVVLASRNANVPSE